MSIRAVGLSLMLAGAGAGAWAAASIALGSQYAFVALGVGVLGGVGAMLAQNDERRKTQIGLAAGCITALAIFSSRFAVMYAEAGHESDTARVAVTQTRAPAIGVMERLQYIGRAGGVHGDLGFYGLLWLALGSLVSFKVATLGEPVGERQGRDQVELPIGKDGLLQASTGIVSMNTPWSAPHDDGLPSLTPADANDQLMPFEVRPQRRAA